MFVGNTYRDVGAIQFYGIALEQIVANNVGERMGGFLSWGQWRPVRPFAGSLFRTSITTCLCLLELRQAAFFVPG